MRFSKADNTPLSYEIERWSTTASDSNAAIWVKVDTIYSAANSYVLMHWGNADSTDKSADSLVFATTNKFMGVWHLKDNPSTTGAIDATANRNNGSSGGAQAPALDDGVIGKGYHFTPIYTEYMDCGKAHLTPTDSIVMLSTWAYYDSTTFAWQGLVGRGSTSGNNYDYRMDLRDNGAFRWNITNGFFNTDTVVHTRQWNYVVFTQYKDTSRLYLNGAFKQKAYSSGRFAPSNTYNFIIGKTHDATFRGIIDEVRAEDSLRDTNWIKLCYNTQKSGAAAVGISVQTVIDTTKPTVTVNQAVGQADPTNALPIHYSVAFSENVTGFDQTDLSWTGVTPVGVNIAGSGASYTINVADAACGNLRPSIAAGKVTDIAGNGNVASISTDNSVTFDTIGPSVTVNQAGGQPDPDSGLPVTFSVVFNDSVNDFVGGNVSWVGSPVQPSAWTVTPSTGTNYTLTVTAVPSDGILKPSIPAGVAHDALGNANHASTSTDSTVRLDRMQPTSSIISPFAGGAYRPLTWPGLSGTATDSFTVAGSGVDSVKVLVRNTTTNRYWNGSSWVSSATWVKATGTASWTLALDSSALKLGGYGSYVDSSRAYDHAGNLQTTPGSSSFLFDRTAPTGAIAIIDSSGYTNEVDPRLSITTSGIDSLRADSMRIDTVGSGSTRPFAVFAASSSINIVGSGPDGRKRVYLQLKDRAGNTSGWYADSTIYDHVVPSCSVLTSGLHNGTTWQQEGGKLKGVARDAMAGIRKVTVTLQRQDSITYWNGSGWIGTPTNLTATMVGDTWSYAISSASLDDAPYAITARAIDNAGNVQASAATGSFTYDNSGPGGGGINIIEVTSGYTNVPRVGLTITPAQGATTMRIGKRMEGSADTGSAAWVPVSTRDSIDIRGSGQDHGVRVFIQFKDVAGNASGWTSDTTTYDSTAPGSTVSTSGVYNAVKWPPAGITGTAQDATSGVDSVYISIRNQGSGKYWNGISWGASNPVWLPATFTVLSWSYAFDSAGFADGQYLVQSKAIDKVDNAQTALGSGTFTYDNTAPTSVAIQVLDKNGYTADPDPTLRLSGGNPRDSMRIGVDTAGTFWKPYADFDSVVISVGGSGLKRVWAQFKDSVGNTSGWMHDSTTYDRNLPTSSIATTGTFNATSWSGSISGSAFDSTSGVDSVYISVQNQSDTLHWNGLDWVAAASWSPAVWNGSNWSCALPVTKLTTATYQVRSRAIDKAGNAQTTAGQESFSYYLKPTASFAPSGLFSAQQGTPVQFTDSSSGAITRWLWRFGDGAGDTVRNPTHAYQDTGQSYSVTLIVQGPGGTDSLVRPNLVLVVGKGQNTVRITGRYLSPTKVQITYTSYEQISSSEIGFPARHIDSLRVYYTANALPGDAAASTLAKEYSVPWLKQQSGGRYVDTLSVTAPTTYDTSYGFMTVLHWSDGALGSLRPDNGCMVLMRDTLRPLNALVLSGSYLGHDSARVYIDSIQKIDSAIAGSIGVWYGLSGDADFGSTGTIWLSAQEVVSKATSGRYTLIITDRLFGLEMDSLQTVNVRLLLKGKNNLYSRDTSRTAFKAGRLPPANPVMLHARALDAGRIRLSWAATAADSIKIWYGTDTVPQQWSIASTRYQLLRPAAGDTADTASGLRQMTWYYFGLQICKDGLWSKITANSSAKDSTPEADTVSILNTIDILTAGFDTATNTIKVIWTIPAADVNNREVGATCRAGAFSLQEPASWSLATAARDTLEIDLGQSIVFDTLYCIAMWMGKPAGQTARYTDNSKTTVAVPAYTWQKLSFFDQGINEVRAFNGTVAVRRDSTYVSDITTATIRAWTPVSASLSGMVLINPGIYFPSPPTVPPLHVGLRYDPSLIPGGYSASDLRIYRLDGTRLIVERSSVVDGANQMVWVKTDELALPFVLLVDTVAPMVDASRAIEAIDPRLNAAINDTFEISDNISNMSWTLLYARGAEAFTSGKQEKTLDSTEGQVTVVIPASGADDNGMRIYLIVDDGVHIDTIDASCRGIRSRSDAVTFEKMEWLPLHVTAELDTQGLSSIFKVLAAQDQRWQYDTRQIRLFRWLPCERNRSAPLKWIEYSAADDSLFTFAPARVIWVKSRDRSSIDFGRGLTLPLNDTFELTLPGRQWTDLALPYFFTMKLKDLLNATGPSGDSVQWYSWEKVAGTGMDSVFQTRGLYIKGIPGLQEDRNRLLLQSGSEQSYSVLNDQDSAVTLKIPAVPVALSPDDSTPLTKRQSTGSWTIALQARSVQGGPLSPLYCGYLQGRGAASYYPGSPSFSPVSVSVFDRSAGVARGHCVLHASNNGGWVYELAFTNASDVTQTVTGTLCALLPLPEGMQAMLYDPARQSWIADSSGEITLDAGGYAWRWLVVGDAGYRDWFIRQIPQWRLGLLSLYPNPVRSIMRINYCIPYSGARSVQFALFDMRGRIVWQQRIDRPHPGVHQVVWNGESGAGMRVSTGAYVLRMTATDAQKGAVKMFKRRITFLPR